MTKYYIRTEKAGAFGTIYFNFQKCVPPIRWRVCTHIQVDTHAWIAANKSAASWNKFANSETGKPIVEKLQLMQHTLEELFNDADSKAMQTSHLLMRLSWLLSMQTQ